MDSYPDDLLTGVSPLVFAVDAILPPPETDNAQQGTSVEEADTKETSQDTVESERSSSSSTRSLFDRFLDAIAASLVEEEPDSPKSLNRNGSDTFASLLRGDDNSSSDEDDDRSLDSVRRNAFARRASPMPSFRAKRTPSGNAGSSSNHADSATAYARVLSSERFFQRARILSISTKHGFPPSKDPDGTQNRAILSSQSSRPISMAPGAMSASALRRKTMIATEGILPAGWLEKHVHALPSALLVITTLSVKRNANDNTDSSNHDQDAQTQHLLNTIQQLKYNLAPKRECYLHVVCLVDDDPSPSILQTDAWLTMVKHHTELPPSSISLISVKDLQADMVTSSLLPSLRDLHVTVREASLAYYLNQARRAKYKHSLLGHEHQPALLPLAARYCFKIGIFYEFQLKHEKSLKFLALAYRHVQAYYQFLMTGASSPTTLEMMNPQDVQVKPALPDGEEVGIEVSLADASDEEEEEEPPAAAIPPADLKRDGGLRRETAETVPDDMTHQCRAVADWLNFKLLQAAFMATALGAKEEGIMAASWQWRKHAQVMLRQNDDPHNPTWNFWAYVAHQRLVMSQLVERHPPIDVAMSEEVLVRCSPWRNYMAAAEAELMVGEEMRKETSESVTTGSSSKHASQSMRLRFVGDLDSEGLLPKLYELSKQDHTDKALHLTLHAIELFEQELKSRAMERQGMEGEDNHGLFTPSGARLHYMAGGILSGLNRYREAIPYLEKAARSCTKWDGLDLSIQKMLATCYRYSMPPPPPDSSIWEHDRKMFGTIFRSGLPLSELRPVVDSYFKLRGTGSLEWNMECTDESDTSMPFLFSVTFPNSTHATAGDTVSALVTIRSNLKFPVNVTSITLRNACGQIAVPSSDITNAENAEKGVDGSIVVPPMTSVHFFTDIALPRDLAKIASMEGGNTAPVTRPRTAGLTSAAGARFVSEDRFGSLENNGQWSKSLLGGKPLLCGGMSLVFAPAYDSVPSESASSHLVELVIQKKKPKSVAPPKRTPFEENNYVESAWARPSFVPLSRGPRCLRVLGPMPHMIVTNLTDASVNGKALEGTVNRFLFKLEAGAGECCHDIEYKVTCSTTLLSADGTTTHLNPEEGVPPSTEGEADLQTVGKRTPVIVSLDKSGSMTARRTDFGYDLPLGWCLEGTGHASDRVFHSVPNLKAGESTYICFELYRPSKFLKPLEDPSADKGQSPEVMPESDVCQTNFDISITYRQSRQSQNATENEMGEKELSDLVQLEHSGSVIWESPICAEFSVDGRSQRPFPSGSRHPSNYLSSSASESQGLAQSELALINGEITSARCSLRSNVADDGLGVEITRIGFEEKDGAVDKGDSACELRLQTGTLQWPGVLFAPSGEDSSRILTNGSKFGVAYSVQPLMKEHYIKGSVSMRLGVIWVDWHPISTPLPEDVPQSAVETLHSHGPLRLPEPSTLKFRGPPCYIEDAPFETVLESLPPSPRVAVPFEMSYRISNKTGMQQKLSVLMSDQSDGRESGSMSEGVLVSGLVNGDLTLSPFESQTLSYTAFATKAGKTTMPALSISSERYKTWLVKDKYDGSREIFVLP